MTEKYMTGSDNLEYIPLIKGLYAFVISVGNGKV